MYKVFSQEQLEAIKYMPRPDGKTDVWLRKSVEQTAAENIGSSEEDAGPVWQADETFLPECSMTLEEVQENFTELLLDADKVKAEMTAAVQAYMDAKAQERGYDSILSACSYVDTGITRFDDEGAACRAWRSAVWDKCYAVLGEVLAGMRAVPSTEELIAELPELEW